MIVIKVQQLNTPKLCNVENSQHLFTMLLEGEKEETVLIENK